LLLIVQVFFCLFRSKIPSLSLIKSNFVVKFYYDTNL
jgi:hypothetical protein